MKVIVFAYQQLGCIGIKALIDAGFQIQAVFTHRGGTHDFSQSDSVAKLAAQSKIPVWSPEDINHPLWIERIRQMAPEMLFVFGYRQLVKPEILALPLRGCYHLHQALLPCYRGQFPLNQALAAGEDRTGITLHVMTATPGGGDIVAQSEFSIDDNDSVMNVYEKANIAAQELLTGILPAMKSGVIVRRVQDESRASRFLGRTPTGGLIDWARPAREIRNLIRSETSPFPGAFTFLAGRKYRIWQGSESPYKASEIVPGTILAVEPLTVGCGNNTALEIDFAQAEDGIYLTGAQLAEDAHLVSGMIFADAVCRSGRQRTKVLVLGVNGFIGSAVSERLLADGKYEVYGMDLRSNYLAGLMSHPDFHFFEGDIQINREWIEYHVRKCDVVLPLVAIATPIEYTRNPLRVFELDFEENLRIVRLCHQYGKRLIFPSTSEVYAMCDDETFDEDNSRLILGPIRMQRWIYSCSKQMLDRVIWAYGTKGLNFTIFRPFNWMGPKLDSLDSARLGSSRAITQLILNLVEGNPILLIDGGAQKRCFTHVTDGIECLFKIIENADKRCDGKIINIGNPENEASIRELAEILVNLFERHPLRKKFPPFAGYKEIESGAFYGQGYQDCQHRKPSIKNAWKYCDWQPVVPLEASIGETLDFFLRQAMNSEEYLK